MILPKINIGGATYRASFCFESNAVTLINPRTKRVLRVDIDNLADVRADQLRDILIAHDWTIVEG